MLPDRVSNPGPLTYESGALPIVLRGPAVCKLLLTISVNPKPLSSESGHINQTPPPCMHVRVHTHTHTHTHIHKKKKIAYSMANNIKEIEI